MIDLKISPKLLQDLKIPAKMFFSQETLEDTVWFSHSQQRITGKLRNKKNSEFSGEKQSQAGV